jgi:hypothetical protein
MQRFKFTFHEILLTFREFVFNVAGKISILWSFKLMPLFPKQESEIVALTQRLIGGLNANSTTAVDVPVDADELNTLVAEFRAHITAINESRSQMSQSRKAKRKTLKQIAKAVKADLRYLEIVTDGSDAELNKYGWGARRKKRELGVPEQPRYLEIIKQDAGSFVLDWKAPIGGGKPSAYKIQRMSEGEQHWQDIATALKTEIELVGQPRKTVLLFRVIAINRAGESLPSNTVNITL